MSQNSSNITKSAAGETASEPVSTPMPAEKAPKASAETPETHTKKQNPRGAIKRKREVEESQREEAQKKLKETMAAILAAAPSAEKVSEVLKGEKDERMLTLAITNIAITAKQNERDTKARIAALWPSIEKQLQAQMSFSKNLKRGCQKQLKLEIPMVPEEAPRQWMKEYDDKNLIMFNAKDKKLLTDSATQLKFTAAVSLGKSIGWGYTSGGLSVNDGLTFTYCKVSRTLTITGKYGLGF